jgi:hypothetical protein
VSHANHRNNSQMNTDDAYNIIIDYLSKQNHIEVLNRLYDPEIFGNFVIGFTDYDKKMSIVCDRGEIYLCNGLNGDHDCTFILPSVFQVGEAELIAALHEAK